MAARALAPLASVERLSPLVIRILAQNPGSKTLQGTNTYLVGNGPSVALIDTGEPRKPEYLSLLSSTLTSHDFHISSILLTHWHPDHVGGCNDVLGLIGRDVPVYKYPHSTDAASINRKITEVDEGAIIEVSGGTLHVMHTPGHTKDSISLLLVQENAVFCGDLILGGSSAEFDNYALYMNSLHRLEELSPTIIYTGHGIAEEQGTIKRYIAHRMHREKAVLETLRAQAGIPVSVAQLTALVYKDDNLTDPILIAAAGRIVGLMLEKLAGEGTAVQEQGGLWTASS